MVTKLGAMVVYESLMHWRRRVVTFLILLLLIGLVGFSIFTKDATSRTPMSVTYGPEGEIISEVPLPQDRSMEDFAQRFPGDAPEWIQTVSFEQYMNDRNVVLLLGVALLPLLISIPPLFSDTIPLDRQSKVRELLETLPIGKTVYLAGKVIGLWFCLIIGLLFCALIYGLVFRMLFGVYDLALYTAFWLLVIIPASLVMAGAAVLLASGGGSRRIALLIGLVLIPVGFILYANIYTRFIVSGMGLSPAVPLSTAATYGEVVGALLASILQAMLPFLLALPMVWGLAWGWTTWSDSKTLRSQLLKA